MLLVHTSWISCLKLLGSHSVLIRQPLAGVMSEIALTGPHYVSVVCRVSEWSVKATCMEQKKHRLTISTVPEAWESAGRSQEHLP